MPTGPAPMPATSRFASMLGDIWASVGGHADHLARVVVAGEGSLPSVFPVTDLAAAAVAAAGLAVSELVSALDYGLAPVAVDRRLASFWFGTALRPDGWSPPPPWDPIAGDYRAADGWIRLHTNAPHHRAAALSVLGVEPDRDGVARAVATWSAEALDAAVVGQGGCAAAMRTSDAWATHEQGRFVACEPLVATRLLDAGPPAREFGKPERPLRGIRVLDLTRVLAGPVATRFLAGYGAAVLRIDPPGWDEPGIVPEVMLGKATARLDLRNRDGHDRLLGLLAQADILIHGYRPGALEALGLGAAERQRAGPGLVDVSLDAYGWTGPWAGRRGFDSLVQMSTGIAEAGMRGLGRDRPTPLPVQALDHATGYIMAAAAIRGLVGRLETGRGFEARASLARTAALLTRFGASVPGQPLEAETSGDQDTAVEHTSWGPARRLRAPVDVEGRPMIWDRAARAIGSDPPQWPA